MNFEALQVLTTFWDAFEKDLKISNKTENSVLQSTFYLYVQTFTKYHNSVEHGKLSCVFWFFLPHAELLDTSLNSKWRNISPEKIHLSRIIFDRFDFGFLIARALKLENFYVFSASLEIQNQIVRTHKTHVWYIYLHIYIYIWVYDSVCISSKKPNNVGIYMDPIWSYRVWHRMICEFHLVHPCGSFKWIEESNWEGLRRGISESWFSQINNKSSDLASA